MKWKSVFICSDHSMYLSFEIRIRIFIEIGKKKILITMRYSNNFAIFPFFLSFLNWDSLKNLNVLQPLQFRGQVMSFNDLSRIFIQKFIFFFQFFGFWRILRSLNYLRILLNFKNFGYSANRQKSRSKNSSMLLWNTSLYSYDVIHEQCIKKE